MNTRVGTALSLHRTLRDGSRGRDVERLQNRLAELGFAVGESDGLYGWRTKRAVEGIQRLLGLKPDGVVGRRTGAILSRPRLPVRIESYCVRSGDTLKGVARRLETTRGALLRANGMPSGRPRPLEEGQPLFSVSRILLGVCCGYLKASWKGWPGPSTGMVYDVEPDGSVSAVGGDCDGHGIPVFRVSGDSSLLSDGRLLAEAAKQIRLQAARTEEASVLLVLPAVTGAISCRLLTMLKAVRRELPRPRTLVACIPMLEGRGSNPGRPALDLRLVLRSADYAVLMAWKESAAVGSERLLAPLPWVASSIRPAVRGVDPWRVILGICGCAFKRKPDTGECEPIPYSGVGRALSAYSTEGDWDVGASSPTFSCRRRGVGIEYLWESGWSVKLKAMLADRMRLGGIAVFDAAWAHPDIVTRIGEVYKISPAETVQ